MTLSSRTLGDVLLEGDVALRNLNILAGLDVSAARPRRVLGGAYEASFGRLV